MVPEQQKEREGEGEVGDELGMGGGHAVAFAVHFCMLRLHQCLFSSAGFQPRCSFIGQLVALHAASDVFGGLTFWPFFLDGPL